MPRHYLKYTSENQKRAKPGLYLALFHGFTSEKKRQEANDWGEHGPMIGPLQFAHTTYGTEIKLQFKEAKDNLIGKDLSDPLTASLSVNNGGCVIYGGMQYGDWTVFNAPVEE